MQTPPPAGPSPSTPPLPAQAAAPSGRDASDLDTLSILFFVWAGLHLLSTLVVVGILAVALGNIPSGGEAYPATVVLIVILVFATLLSAALLTLEVITARSLRQRRRHTLCIVMAAVVCLSFPLGTALGIYALIVLLRPSVKSLFAAPPAGHP